MKRFGLASVLLCIPIKLFAIHPAHDGDEKRIQAYLDDAKLSETRLPILDNQIESMTEHGLGGSAEAQKLRARLASERRRMDADRNKAIQLTLTAFGIVRVDADGHPLPLKGTAVTKDPSEGRPIQWVVVFGQNVPRLTQGAKGETETVGPAKVLNGRPPAALTASDGVTIVFPTALTSPKDLAVYLYHEKRHFVQYTTKGLGDVLNGPATEADAYRLTKKAIRSVGYSKAEQDAKLPVVDGYISTEETKAKLLRAIEKLTFPFILPASRPPAPNADAQRRKLGQQQAQTITALERDEKLPDFRLPEDRLAAIRSGGESLRERIDQENAVMEGIDFENSRPPTQPEPLPTVPVIDFPTAPSDAWDMAVKICGGAGVSQEDLNRVVGWLKGHLRYHGFPVPSVTSCETKVFSEMAAAAEGGRSLSAGWTNSLTRKSYCQSAAAEGNAVYRETIRAAQMACHAPGGINDAMLSDLVARSFRNTDSAVPLSQLDSCENDIYFMLCEGTSNGGDWGAAAINARVQQLARQSQPSGSNGGSSVSQPDDGGRPGTERSGNLDLSRPIHYVAGLHSHPSWD